jgi:hypothetical protein
VSTVIVIIYCSIIFSIAGLMVRSGIILARRQEGKRDKPKLKLIKGGKYNK